MFQFPDDFFTGGDFEDAVSIAGGDEVVAIGGDDRGKTASTEGLGTVAVRRTFPKKWNGDFPYHFAFGIILFHDLVCLVRDEKVPVRKTMYLPGVGVRIWRRDLER